jgi:hypothetical protein
MRAVVLTAIITLFVFVAVMSAASASDILYPPKQANNEGFGNITNNDAWSMLEYTGYPSLGTFNLDVSAAPVLDKESLDIYQSKTGEEQPKARVVWEYRETPDFYSSWGGDADRLPNGNTLIADTENKRIIEVTPEGEKVWEVFFGTVPPEGETVWEVVLGGWTLYRSERISDFDLSRTKLYNSSGYPTPHNITVNVLDSNKTCDGITFVNAWGYLWGINMTGHAIWRYKGVWLETKEVQGNHLLLLGTKDLFSPIEVREIDLNGNVIFSEKLKKGHHDVIKLTKDVIIYPVKTYRYIDNKWIRGDEIRMKYLPLNWVFWKWNTFDYLPLEHNCPECMSLWWRDWTHCNSITLIMEDVPVLYLDVRNLNQIVKINCATKEIIWKLGEHGDFKMYEMDGTEVSKLFSHQHDPEILPNGNILLFDNGLHRGTETNYSRVIEIELAS